MSSKVPSTTVGALNPGAGRWTRATISEDPEDVVSGGEEVVWPIFFALHVMRAPSRVSRVSDTVRYGRPIPPERILGPTYQREWN
jgi:hypothetical protein